MLERTTSDARPDREFVIASGRLNVKNSMSAAGRSIRNGRTSKRVTATGASVFADSTGIRNR
jgi:hypothetical protein